MIGPEKRNRTPDPRRLRTRYLARNFGITGARAVLLAELGFGEDRR